MPSKLYVGFGGRRSSSSSNGDGEGESKENFLKGSGTKRINNDNYINNVNSNKISRNVFNALTLSANQQYNIKDDNQILLRQLFSTSSMSQFRENSHKLSSPTTPASTLSLGNEEIKSIQFELSSFNDVNLFWEQSLNYLKSVTETFLGTLSSFLQNFNTLGIGDSENFPIQNEGEMLDKPQENYKGDRSSMMSTNVFTRKGSLMSSFNNVKLDKDEVSLAVLESKRKEKIVPPIPSYKKKRAIPAALIPEDPKTKVGNIPGSSLKKNKEKVRAKAKKEKRSDSQSKSPHSSASSLSSSSSSIFPGNPFASSSSSSYYSLVEGGRSFRLITDIDDTVQSSGGKKLFGVALGGIDTQYRRGTQYPGAFIFALQLTRFNTSPYRQPLDVAVLTARAREFKFALELKPSHPISTSYRIMGESQGVAGWGIGPVLYGSVKEWILQKQKFNRKIDNFGKLLSFDGPQSSEYIFVGDTGEYDEKVGEKLAKLYPQNIRAVFLHVVSENPIPPSCFPQDRVESQRIFPVSGQGEPKEMTIQTPIYYFKTYLGAALKACKGGLLDINGLIHVANTTTEEIEKRAYKLTKDQLEDLKTDLIEIQKFLLMHKNQELTYRIDEDFAETDYISYMPTNKSIFESIYDYIMRMF